MDFIDLVKIYGPLAIGWVLYVYERKINADLQAQTMAAFIEDTKAKILHQVTLERLVDLVERK